MRVYQNVFTLRGKTYIREFDTESKETFFKEETVIPEIFIEDKNGNYSSFVNLIRFLEFETMLFQNSSTLVNIL